MIVSSLLRTCDYYRLANRCWKLRSFSGTTLARNAEYVNSVSNFAHCWGCIFGRQYYFCFLHSSDEVWWINEKSWHLCRDRTTKKNIWILGPVQTHPDFFEKGDLLLRFQGKNASCWQNMMYDIIVLENLRFRPSTRKREAGLFNNLHSGELFEKMHFQWRFSANTYMWTVGQTGKKISVNSNKTDVSVDRALVVGYWAQLLKRWITLSTR